MQRRAPRREEGHPIAGSHSPTGFFVLRTPLLPVDTLARWTGEPAVSAALDADGGDLDQALATDRTRLRSGLSEFLSPAVREALHVASPDLHAALEYWTTNPDSDRGRRVERSLVRYLSRIASRPTPFGLFAGISVGRIDAHTNLEIESASSHRRHTRLDSAYLARLVAALCKDAQLRGRLRFRPNSTLFPFANRLRYVEWRAVTTTSATDGFHERTHHLVAVDDTRYIRQAINCADVEGGATIETVAASLTQSGIASDRAVAFVESLVENQILLPELPLYVTGPDPLTAIEQTLRESGATETAGCLRDVRDALASLDASGVGHSRAEYDEIVRRLDQFPAPIDRGHLFHVDLFKGATQARLGPTVIRELLAGAELLRRVVSSGDTLLDQFRDAFVERYHGRAVPLLEALDDEVGLGFPVRSAPSDAEPLLAGLAFPPRGESTVRWGVREATLLRLLNTALVAGEMEISLSRDDVDAISMKNAPPLADSFSVMGVVAARSEDAVRRGDFQLRLQGLSGPSGAQLLGRFCHGDERLLEFVRGHLRGEEACDADAIFAEVAHLAHPRAGNLVSRPVLREFEIAYMGHSGAPATNQIPASDLLVSVQGQHVVLHSKRLGRRVVPRLSTAHAFEWRTLAPYRFLGALQMQGVAAGAWSWGALADAPCLPRVRSGRLVLSVARWRLDRRELEALGAESGASLMRAVHRLRQRRRLPRVVQLADADNSLLVDFENILSVESFVQLVRQRPVAVLEEVFPGPDDLCAHGPEGRFTHELVVPFTRVASAPTAAVRSPRRPDDSGAVAARRHAPGSEWLYVKIYTGTTIADRVLQSAIAPFVREAIDRRWIDRWFFIRYADPESHLRVRVHGDPSVLHEYVLPALHRALATDVELRRVSRVQLDTYEQEVERYGGPEGMTVSERLFHLDSDAALALAALSVTGRLSAADRWRVALMSTRLLLRDFGISADGQRAQLRSLREAYRKEYRLESRHVSPISDRYREERPKLLAIAELMFGPGDSRSGVTPGIQSAVDILRRRSLQLAEPIRDLRMLGDAGTLSTSFDDIVTSHLHMSLVRQLRSAVRAQEAVIYDFLERLATDPRVGA